jgi:hypothetical protein
LADEGGLAVDEANFDAFIWVNLERNNLETEQMMGLLLCTFGKIQHLCVTRVKGIQNQALKRKIFKDKFPNTFVIR